MGGLHGSWVLCTQRAAWWRAKTSDWDSVATWMFSREFPTLICPEGSKSLNVTLDGMVGKEILNFAMTGRGRICVC